MLTIKNQIVLCLCLLFLIPNTAISSTVPAASCSKADVESAISSAIAGDTVTIPAGTCNWASTITVNKQLTFVGTTTVSRSAVTYVVTPSDSTIITGYGFDVLSAGTRISGITFQGQASAVVIGFGTGASVGSKIDSCHFDGTGRVFTKGNLAGLIVNHCLFKDQSGDEPFYIGGNGNTAWTNGNTYTDWNVWQTDIALTNTGGTTRSDENTYFENCEFRLTSSAPTSEHNLMDMGEGARVVLRYNLFQMAQTKIWQYLVESHGHCWGYRDGTNNAGTYLFEMYNNKFDTANETSSAYPVLFRPRGGRNYVYNNALTGTGWLTTYQIRLRNDEVSTANCNSTPCAVQAHEDNYWHQVPISGDPNYSGGLCIAYPCAQQINNSYFWSNTQPDPFLVSSEVSTTFHTENRDYWDDAGVGDTDFTTGVIGSRPAGSDGDCYWATDELKLYRKISGSWTQIYAQYTYPHPNAVAPTSTPTATSFSGGVISGGAVK